MSRAKEQTTKSGGRRAGWGLVAVGLLVATAVGGWTAWGLGWLNRPVAPTITATANPPTSPRSTGLSSAAATGQPIANTPGATPLSGSTAPTPAAYGVVISRALNMRQEPNTAAAVLTSFKSGDIVELTRRSGGWYQTVGGGWVSALYIEVRQTRPEAESFARELAGGQ